VPVLVDAAIVPSSDVRACDIGRLIGMVAIETLMEKERERVRVGGPCQGACMLLASAAPGTTRDPAFFRSHIYSRVLPSPTVL
jgi:hypothetical protein